MSSPTRPIPLACCWLSLFSLLFAAGNGHAHDTGSSYLILTVRADQIMGRWEIGLHDLDDVLKLGADRNGTVSREELRARFPSVTNYCLSHLKLKADGATRNIRVTDTGPLVEASSKGTNVVLNFVADETSQPKVLELGYRLFFTAKPQHRGLLLLDCNGRRHTAMFSPDRPTQRFDLAVPSPGSEFLAFCREGIWHIWIGFDHILFLLALLLPSVLEQQANEWKGAARFRDAFFNVFKIVTAFTVAHSVTLSLAALNLITLSSRWVESAIAASVLIAAVNNLRPFFRGRAWLVAFGFGLVHGFGFAAVLTELGLPQDALALALVGFNVGVEAGQLAIVAAFLPLAYRSRESWIYQKICLRVGSGLIVVVSCVWLLERAFDLKR
jgi:HupE/UreJ protein